jgi:hypothetical protein
MPKEIAAFQVVPVVKGIYLLRQTESVVKDTTQQETLVVVTSIL